MSHSAPSPSSSPEPFELSGGALCLDFVNTWGDRGRPDTDQLRSFGALIAFARQAESAAPATADVWARVAGQDPADAARSLADARKLRETLYGLFSAVAAGRPCPVADLEVLNGALVEALPHLRLVQEKGVITWRWDEEGSLQAPLWPIARSAALLLTSEEAARVRECNGERCTWLFLDRSRNRSRRWCSMESCGNRAKSRRHYRRHKARPFRLA